MLTPTSHTDLSKRYRRHEQRDSAYRVRLLGTLAAVLLMVLVIFQLPISAPKKVGWLSMPTYGELHLTDVQIEETQPVDSPPITAFEESGESSDGDEQQQRAGSANPTTTSSENETSDSGPNSRLVKQMALRSTANEPHIIGGVGTYYLNIQYPEEAIRDGIEGRLELDFVVNEDGTASQIRVITSLHPLCDSAAVRALRETKFVPGRQNGEKVSVRMRLPVHFKLVSSSEAS